MLWNLTLRLWRYPKFHYFICTEDFILNILLKQNVPFISVSSKQNPVLWLGIQDLPLNPSPTPWHPSRRGPTGTTTHLSFIFIAIEWMVLGQINKCSFSLLKLITLWLKEPLKTANKFSVTHKQWCKTKQLVHLLCMN